MRLAIAVRYRHIQTIALEFLDEYYHIGTHFHLFNILSQVFWFFGRGYDGLLILNVLSLFHFDRLKSSFREGLNMSRFLVGRFPQSSLYNVQLSAIIMDLHFKVANYVLNNLFKVLKAII
jgi:hypothetical protein